MGSLQPAEHLLHVSDEGPLCSSMPKTEAEHFSISAHGIKTNELSTEDITADQCLSSHDHDYLEKINKLEVYLDKVRKIVKPGCSLEVLNAALNSMSLVAETLSMMSSRQYHLYSSL